MLTNLTGCVHAFCYGFEVRHDLGHWFAGLDRDYVAVLLRNFLNKLKREMNGSETSFERAGKERTKCLLDL
jgi:hypothetical protein